MTAQPRNGNSEPISEPDLIDRIANALPEELRGDYYREMAHCRALPENDEMLRILRAMQFLAVLIEQTPARLAAEREQLAGMLSGAVTRMEATHQAGVSYQKQLEARLGNLPDEIAKGISADAIAAKVSERVRQQLQETGLTGLAEAVGVQATGLRKVSKDLSTALDAFSHPRHGAVAVINEGLASLKANIGNASDHIRAQMSNLGRELWTALAAFFAVGVAIGFAGGILYYRWITTTPDQPSSMKAPATHSTPGPAAKGGR